MNCALGTIRYVCALGSMNYVMICIDLRDSCLFIFCHAHARAKPREPKYTHTTMLGLLKKDQIVTQRSMTTADRKNAEEQTGIQYIISQISRTVYRRGMQSLAEKPKGPGSRVFCLVSPMGTGKSALIAPSIYDTFKNESRRGILLSQPVRATTMDIPFQIAKFNKHIVMGDNIGYQTGTVAKKPRSGILVCTVGILAQFLKTMDPEHFMRKYAFILIDEVHLRSIELDICLYLLERLLSAHFDNPLCPTVLLMSGTFDPAPLMRYFKCPATHLIEVKPAPSFPITDHFTAWDLSNYAQYVEDLVAKIHVSSLEECQGPEQPKHILCFAHSTAVITSLIDRIDHLNAVYFGQGATAAMKFSEAITGKMKSYAERSEGWHGGGRRGNRRKANKSPRHTQRSALLAVPLLSALISAEGKEYSWLYADSTQLTVPIYALDEHGGLDRGRVVHEAPVARKVLIGTNAIETGLTIHNLKYCVDTGFSKDVSWQPNYMVDLIIDRPIPKSSMMQRRGRVGRTSPGQFFGCYTEETVKGMHPQQQPDIVRNNAAALLLSILVSETGSRVAHCDGEGALPYSFQMNQLDQYWYAVQFDTAFCFSKLRMFQLPPSDAVISGLDQLYTMGFITHEYLPTAMGIYANQVRKLSLPLIRMIFASYHTGASTLDMITLACFMSCTELLKINKKMYKGQNVLRASEEESKEFANEVVQDECIEYLFLWYEIMDILERIVRAVDKRAARMKVGMGERMRAGDSSERSEREPTVAVKNRNKVGMGERMPAKIGRAQTSMLPLNYLTDFAEEQGIKFPGLLAVIEMRDELIAEFLSLGLNPYYNGLSLQRGTYSLVDILRKNRAEGLQEIAKIKQCIYEGHRFNLCTFDAQKNSYICVANNVPIKLNSPVIDRHAPEDRPRAIIPTQILITSKVADEYDYQFVGRDICVLDDYVAVDTQFIRM